MIRFSAADHCDDDHRSHGDKIIPATDQQLGSETTMPNPGTLLIYATFVPDDIRRWLSGKVSLLGCHSGDPN
jgi:hypothetical protein